MKNNLIRHIYTGIVAALMFAAVVAPSPDAYKRPPEVVKDPAVQTSAAPAPDGFRKSPEVERDTYRRP
jgi:hypothetical protein